MNGFAQRRVSVVVLIAGICLLSGCSVLPTDSTEKPSSRDTEANEPRTDAPKTPTEPPPERRGPADISFETGADLDLSQWQVQWLSMLEGGSYVMLSAADGFGVTAPDDGSGSSGYVDNASQCKINFYQGAVTDLDPSHDDRTLSDDMIAAVASGVTSTTREDVANHAWDDLIARVDVERQTVPVRTISATNQDGSSWLISARMFGTLDGSVVGVTVLILCPSGQDAYAEFTKLRDNYLAIDVGPV